MGKNVLITGGLGLIGSSLAKKCLEKDHKVTILSRSDKKLKNVSGFEDKLNIIYKDISKIDSEVIGKDYIFHLASTVDNYNINENPYLDININCNGTIALLEAVRKNNPDSRIVYASTFFVNGNLDKLPATPESPVNPLGLYPATKLASENFCKVYNSVFDMNSVIARFTNIFGENEDPNNKKKAGFNYLVNLAVKDEEVPVYGDGKFKRDYIYVDDASSGLLKIAEKGEKNQVYYVGRGEGGTKFIDLINIVIEESCSGRVKYINPPEFHNKVGIKDFYADTTPLKNLGWKPEVSLRQGIKKVVEKYKNE
jgi:UDP-glucose 4-epimerase